MAKIENYGFSKGLKNPFLSLLTISNKSSNVKSCENLNWLKIEKNTFNFKMLMIEIPTRCHITWFIANCQ